jgi:hypothetical protein
LREKKRKSDFTYHLFSCQNVWKKVVGDATALRARLPVENATLSPLYYPDMRNCQPLLTLKEHPYKISLVNKNASKKMAGLI